jgi:hypothetical protein
MMMPQPDTGDRAEPAFTGGENEQELSVTGAMVSDRTGDDQLLGAACSVSGQRDGRWLR